MRRSPHSQALHHSHAAAKLTTALPSLLLAAERVAAQVQMGVHGRRRVGQGESFWQFRRYQPGDDAGRIDWHSSARTQHVFIREHEWEAAQTLLLWVDHTASMAWHSDKKLPTKLYRAVVLALAIARLALEAGEQVALLQAPQRRFRGKASLADIAYALLHTASVPYPPALPLPRFASVLVVSDFLNPLPPWHKIFALWAEQGCLGHVLQVLDPAELDPPWQGRVLLTGTEGEAAVLAPHFEDWRAPYQAKLAAQRHELTRLTKALGWTVLLHNTGQPPQSDLMQLYQHFGAHAARQTLGQR
jgi:uncharacterized protein (DUF58 family)